MCFYCDREVKGNAQAWWYQNYVCWSCRVQNGISNQSEEKICKETDKGGRICYRCHKQMVNVGFKFKTPKKSDIKKWKQLEKTWENQHITINGVNTYIGPKNRVVKQSF